MPTLQGLPPLPPLPILHLVPTFLHASAHTEHNPQARWARAHHSLIAGRISAGEEEEVAAAASSNLDSSLSTGPSIRCTGTGVVVVVEEGMEQQVAAEVAAQGGRCKERSSILCSRERRKEGEGEEGQRSNNSWSEG